MSHVNEFGQPVGESVDWTPGATLVPVVLTGRTCRLEPLVEGHVDGLYAALCVDSPPETWTYISDGPFEAGEDFDRYVDGLSAGPATIPLAILVPDGRGGWSPVGIACWLRIDPANGTAEVGSITMGAALQRTTASTEAMYLMAAHAFDVVGVRRYEWKCDSLNEPSRRAAARLGFTFEGVFRNAVVYKGRSRDTAWFAITDDEWPDIRSAFQRWLDPASFDESGRQRAPLATTGSTTTDLTTKEERAMTDLDLTDDKRALKGTEIFDAGLDGWRKVLDRLIVRFETGDFNAGAALVTKIAEAADAANHHPDVDLRYPHLTVALKSHDVNAITARDIRLARKISELAAAAGISAAAHAPDVLEFAIDTPDDERIRPFWAAILGYQTQNDEVTDGAGRAPTVWFQKTDSEAADRQRWHVDISVPHDAAQERIKAALDAGGTLVSDARAPAFWVLADADGNKACICTWESRD